MFSITPQRTSHRQSRRAAVAVATFALLLVAFGNQSSAYAQLNGGRGPVIVRSAWNLEPGYLTLYGQMRMYGKVVQVPRAGIGTTGATLWDVQGAASLNLGISRHFEASIAPVVYQDTHKGAGADEFNLPDNMLLRLKIANFGQRGGSMKYGVELGSRIPLGKAHNIPFEQYSVKRVGFGFTLLASYARDPLYPEDGISVHFNAGYWNHNDVGIQLLEHDPTNELGLVTQMTQEFSYGAAVVFPSDRFDFRFELFGTSFLKTPPPAAYSQEPVSYFSPGVTYKAYRWLNLNFSGDLRVSGNVDNTTYGKLPIFPSNVPNYPSWRVNVGAKLTLLPTSLYSVSERDLLMQKAESRRELFEQIIKEQRETESAEAELERIKEERRKAERELERLRQILEGEARRQQQDQSYQSSNGSQPQPK